MKRVAPWEDAFSILSDDDSHVGSCSKKEAFRVNGSNKLPSFEGALIRKAKMYQDFMKNIPIPNKRGSSVPFTSWKELGSSLKLLYNQPLHYLTNTLLSQWDRALVGSESENELLDSIVHPIKAEAIIWANEEIHRLTFCHLQLAKLWALDPMYEAFIDSVLPSW